MSDFVPCFEWTSSCNLDWAGLSAAVTAAAVIVALVTAHRQVRVARDAVLEERRTAVLVQQREWDALQVAHRKAAKLIAIGCARELAYARRELIPMLLDWDPAIFKHAGLTVLKSYVSDSPFRDLIFIRTNVQRMEILDEKQAHRLLSILTSWQFFNANPGPALEDVLSSSPDKRSEDAQRRVAFGLKLLESIEEGILELETYIGDGPIIASDLSLTPPKQLESELEDLRGRSLKWLS